MPVRVYKESIYLYLLLEGVLERGGIVLRSHGWCSEQSRVSWATAAGHTTISARAEVAKAEVVGDKKE